MVGEGEWPRLEKNVADVDKIAVQLQRDMMGEIHVHVDG
jgi:hypothetical protein